MSQQFKVGGVAFTATIAGKGDKAVATATFAGGKTITTGQIGRAGLAKPVASKVRACLYGLLTQGKAGLAKGTKRAGESFEGATVKGKTKVSASTKAKVAAPKGKVTAKVPAAPKAGDLVAWALGRLQRAIAEKRNLSKRVLPGRMKSASVALRTAGFGSPYVVVYDMGDTVWATVFVAGKGLPVGEKGGALKPASITKMVAKAMGGEASDVETSAPKGREWVVTLPALEKGETVVTNRTRVAK